MRGSSRERRKVSCLLKPGALNGAEVCLDERRVDRLAKKQSCLERDETVERRASPFVLHCCSHSTSYFAQLCSEAEGKTAYWTSEVSCTLQPEPDGSLVKPGEELAVLRRAGLARQFEIKRRCARIKTTRSRARVAGPARMFIMRGMRTMFCFSSDRCENQTCLLEQPVFGTSSQSIRLLFHCFPWRYVGPDCVAHLAKLFLSMSGGMERAARSEREGTWWIWPGQSKSFEELLEQASIVVDCRMDGVVSLWTKKQRTSVPGVVFFWRSACSWERWSEGWISRLLARQSLVKAQRKSMLNQS